MISPTSKVRRVLVRVVAGFAAFLVVSTGLIGWLHTTSGRMAYARAFGGGCPMGHADPRAVERGRLAAARAARGSVPAPARPALGFQLDVSTRAELGAWVARNGLACTDRRSGTVLRCTDVPATALGRTGAPVDEVTFAFAPATMRLVNLTAIRAHMTPEQAVVYSGGLTAQLRTQLGAPSRSAGELSPANLAGSAYATSVVYYAFSDFLADLETTNIPGDGVLVREHYMSAVD